MPDRLLPLFALLDIVGEHWPGNAGVGELRRILESGTASRETVARSFPEQAHTRDLYLLCVSTALADHVLTPDELQALAYLRTLLDIEDGELFVTRRTDLERIVSDVMFQVLADQAVDRDESRLKDAVQEALNLGYDEFLSLGEVPLHDALRRIMEDIDPGGHGLSDRQFEDFERSVQRLDTVLPREPKGGGGPDRHVPPHVRDAVWRRDQGRCTSCGNQEALEFDHIIPFSRGGANTYRNVQLLCQTCNRQKSNRIG